MEKNLVKWEGENKKSYIFRNCKKIIQEFYKKNFVFIKIVGKYQCFLVVGVRFCFILFIMIQYMCWEVGEFLGIFGL